MSPDELRQMHRLEDSYWWFVGRRYVLRAWLRRLRLSLPKRPAILDVGCGTGGNTLLLSEFGDVLGVDGSEDALELCRARGVEHLALCPAEALGLQDESFDLVTVFEVLEHIADHRRAVGEAARVLRPGGRLLVTVPAYPWLWSEHDEALGHVRRYTRAELLDLLGAAGLTLERVSHCVSLLLPVTVAFRWAQRAVRRRRGPGPGGARSGLVLLPRPVSALFVLSLRAEAWWLTRRSIPFGVTLIAQARKESPGQA